MPHDAVLLDTVGRISRRDARRTEATLQADIRQFLLLSQFDLDADEVREINLETQLGDGTRRRIDIGVSCDTNTRLDSQMLTSTGAAS